MAGNKSISVVEYEGFDLAFAHLNKVLFGGSLPDVLITLNRKRGARGYFWQDVFESRGDGKSGHEIALNPDNFKGETDERIISTLAHEMAHLWQAEFGSVSRSGYHNKEWAEKMIEIGLQPSDTGEPGGKITGQRMSHYVIEGGPFARAYAQLTKSGFRLNWESRNVEGEKVPKNKNKTAFICPGDGCDQKAWAKAEASLICGNCELQMVPELPGLGGILGGDLVEIDANLLPL